MQTPTTSDSYLWRLARTRAHFKGQLLRYVLVCALLWSIWYLTGHHYHGGGMPWPAWITLFWGLGLATRGLTCYGLWGTESWTEREYQNLVREQQAQQR
ncbi:2TM domain-containing protein [Hymenobacter sp. 15J16-1T3B]|uniref:2TM domain-containing protein n=1 Tax=Hymenobacter sp. 15J16-1T3B TaxID=2886941 RepID=UPI001D1193C0|nr:2TM domain-containing protein [Hymenobacter sp. 15J16-1T3B]MCC3158110.1 2TM domain-containing protein [Hymenobacter sp. 15J16-1T3B]